MNKYINVNVSKEMLNLKLGGKCVLCKTEGDYLIDLMIFDKDDIDYKDYADSYHTYQLFCNSCGFINGKILINRK